MLWMRWHKHFLECDYISLIWRWLHKHAFWLHKHVLRVVTHTCFWLWLPRRAFGYTNMILNMIDTLMFLIGIAQPFLLMWLQDIVVGVVTQTDFTMQLHNTCLCWLWLHTHAFDCTYMFLLHNHVLNVITQACLWCAYTNMLLNMITKTWLWVKPNNFLNVKAQTYFELHSTLI